MEINRIGDISAFVAAVRYGSYTEAAKHLKLSRSAIGKSIVRLETQTNTRLLHRSTRSLSLTDEGRVLFDYCRQILDELEEINQVMDSRRLQPTGTLKLTAPHSFGHRYVLPVLNDFLQQWPDLRADISFTDRFVDLIDEGFDIGIRIGAPESDSQILTRTIGWQKMQTCASPSYLKQHGVPQQPSDLARFDTIFFGRGMAKRTWKFQTEHGVYVFDGPEKMKIDSSEAILTAALSGFGIIHFPTYLVQQHIDTQRLVPILAAYQLEADPIRLIYPSRKHLSPRVRLFIDFLVQRWGGTPPWESGGESQQT